MQLTLLTTLAVAASTVLAAANLEPAAGSVMLGAWYDRNLTDTPSAVNTRLNYKPLAFFQTDMDLSSVVKPWTAPKVVMPQFIQQLEDTKTNAVAMLTLYPFEGYSKITDAQLQEMADWFNKMADAGHSIFVRFASEMNGSWFPYGQDPIGFLASWKRCITFWRNALGANKSKVAFIWSPNSGNGYPYPNGQYSIDPKGTDAATVANLKVLDTNNKPGLDEEDDPYLPYYPGDDYVDWVGMSIYHYGKEWKWVDNVLPQPTQFEDYLQGSKTLPKKFGYAPFYTYFSGPDGVKDSTGKTVSVGNKPLIISETAATYHFAWNENVNKTDPNNARPNTCPVPYCDEPATRVDIKQSWWQSFLNADFVKKYPQMKAVCFFEFIKEEELTLRDFTTFGAAPNIFESVAKFEKEDQDVANAFVADLKAGKMPFLSFAAAKDGTGSAVVTASGSKPTGTGAPTSTTKSGAAGVSVMAGVFAAAGALLFGL
ncbi:mannan endo-1,4-beta-mannosidase [Chytriomyces confervae]|uniref:Mannan endo-1,4-beta-mannosidase n=1 Tax=Chytriomyces confervae TaxID=246404 RepID=A0A507FB63_9FUNG|nr:mannan endo-1,4-beta-mannosidase [Chytriomyces confervae]